MSKETDKKIDSLQKLIDTKQAELSTLRQEKEKYVAGYRKKASKINTEIARLSSEVTSVIKSDPERLSKMQGV